MPFSPRILAALLLVFACGCASPYIQSEDYFADDPGFRIDDEAEIEDSAENLEAINVLLSYRNAIVGKDFALLRRLVSEEYYDNAGTTSTTRDDYGNAQLPEIFELLANHAEDIKYEVVVKDVEVAGDLAFVDYEYEFAYRYGIEGEAVWDAGVELNRLQLRRGPNGWRIVAGL